MKKFLLFVFGISPLFFVFASAQNLKGIWKGHFFGEDGDQYRYEIQIQHLRDSLSGITYAFQDKNFYGKATFHGKFSTSTKSVFIKEIKTIEIRLSKSENACIQTCMLTYVQSGKEEFLEGTYTSTFEKTDSTQGAFRGADCGSGRMLLRKVQSSDFEMESFLITKPVKTEPVSTKPAVIAKNPATKKPQYSTTILRPKIEPVQKIGPTETKPLQKKSVILITPFVLKSRKNILHETFAITSKEVTVKLFDNGEVDNDSVSLFLDNKLVLSKKRLTATAITFKLSLDEVNSERELVIVAENLGKIPPNTALMIVTAGEQRFEVRISSTEQKNALLKFKYAPSEKSIK